MLRLLVWGDTPREKEQAQEILRLHAQLVDLQEKLHQTQQEAYRDLQEAHKGFMDFLRPKIVPGGLQTVQELIPERELPGDRPSTTPAYPTTPPWATGQVETASPA